MPVESTLYRLYRKDYVNAFSTTGFGYGLTENAEIRGFKFGVRIDHILRRRPPADAEQTTEMVRTVRHSLLKSASRDNYGPKVRTLEGDGSPNIGESGLQSCMLAVRCA